MTVPELMALRGQAADAAKVLMDKAEAENRDLTPEESQTYDNHLQTIESATNRIKRWERFESLSDSTPPKPIPSPAPGSPEVGDTRTIKVPATAKPQLPLKAFRGATAMEDAYASAMWLKATLFKNGDDGRAERWCRERGMETRAYSEGTNIYGGYLVPEQFESAVIALREERGVFRREARVVPMTSDTYTQPRRSGGLTAYYTGEAASITESTATWDMVRLVAKKLAILTRMSSEVAEDAAISLADYLAQEIAYAFADSEDKAGFLGDGTSTYGGIEGATKKLAAGSIYTAIAGNTAFSTLDLADLEAMAGQLPQYANANAKWYLSRPAFFASMARLADAAGGVTLAEMTNTGVGRTTMFLGYPVVFSQVMNTTLTAQVSVAGAILFGDLSMGAMLGNRRGITIAQDSSRYLEYDQIAIKATERYDINVTEIGTASVAGCIIGLTFPGA